ncbi:hypothetical protein ACOMHN_028714 [Nucella lapillus]
MVSSVKGSTQVEKSNKRDLVMAMVFFGMATIVLAYGMKALQGPVTQLATTAFGACGGPIVGMFMLGGAFPRANKYGALLGGLTGLAANLWLAIGSRLYGKPTASLPPGPIDNCELGNITTGSTLPNSSSEYDGFFESATDGFQTVVTSSGYDTHTAGINGTTAFDDQLTKDGLVTVSSAYAPAMTNPDDIKEVFYEELNRSITENYREAWDKFKKTSVDLEVFTEVFENNGHDLSGHAQPGERTSDHGTFLQPKRWDAD